MDLIYFFWPKNFKILNIFEVQDRTLTEVADVPAEGVTRVTRYILGGKIHTCLGTSWPPVGHIMRLPIAKAWVESTGRDVTDDMKRLEGPSWLVGSRWVPLFPRVTVSCGLGSHGINFKIKIFKKFFLKDEGPIKIEFSPFWARGKT
jgi:hypothetical protein